jgi:hypothetical protein
MAILMQIVGHPLRTDLATFESSLQVSFMCVPLEG